MNFNQLYAIIEKMQYKNFGQFIRKKRENLGISLNHFAINCDIDSATLSNFERGKSDILFQNFIKIAYGFNSTPATLLEEYTKKN